MSLSSEAEAILQRADLAINTALETDIAQIADECIQFRVQSNVYAKYEPTEYERRGTVGGIADPFMYSHSLDPASHTLTISDERREVGVVESGVGYTWTHSEIYKQQPFPRPYFMQAQEDVYADGEAAAALVRAIQRI